MFLKAPKKLLMTKEGKTNPLCDEKHIAIPTQLAPFRRHLENLKIIHQQSNPIVVRTPPATGSRSK